MSARVLDRQAFNRPIEGRGKLALYASLGPQLLSYAVDVAGVTLTKLSGSVRLPVNVQYACPDTSGRHIYVVSSNGGPGVAGTVHLASAFRIDWESGALHPHGKQIPLPSRPIHIATDSTSEHALIAYNDLGTVTVFRIAPDGTLGAEVKQSTSLDTGIFDHQICVTPSNETAILVARGNDASTAKPEDPGALKVFRYSRGVLTNWMSVAPAGGYGFGPRNIAINPLLPWIYVSLERQNKLYVFPFEEDSIGAEPLFESETLIDPQNVRPKQLAGTVHVHPNGRFVYLANRAFGAAEVAGRKVFSGGENAIVVYEIDDRTGKPTMIQSVDTHGIYPRTFSIDPSGSILVVANVRPLLVRDGATFRMVLANLSVFSVGDDGNLKYVRSYDLDFSPEEPFWSGLVSFGASPGKCC